MFSQLFSTGYIHTILVNLVPMNILMFKGFIVNEIGPVLAVALVTWRVIVAVVWIMIVIETTILRQAQK